METNEIIPTWQKRLDADYQRKVGEFVSREVIHCASTLIYELMQKAEEFPEYQDDLYSLSVNRQEKVSGNQYRLIVDCDERGEFACSVYQINEDGEDGKGVAGFVKSEYSAVQAFCEEYGDPRTTEAWEQYFYETGIDKQVVIIGCSDDPEIEEEESEVFEHWIVTDWLGRKLEEAGETVVFNFMGLTIWGRTCTGQAIQLDDVICNIYDSLNS